METGNIISKSIPMDVCRNKLVILSMKSNNMSVYIVEAKWYVNFIHKIKLYVRLCSRSKLVTLFIKSNHTYGNVVE